jgi:hypothetical protein
MQHSSTSTAHTTGTKEYPETTESRWLSEHLGRRELCDDAGRTLVAASPNVPHNCMTSPTIAQPVCPRAADRFAIIGGLSFGYAPSFISSWWTANSRQGSF